MAGKWEAPMGHLSRIDERPTDCAGQTARDQTGWRGRDMAFYDGEVPALGDRERGKECLRDSTTGGGSGSRDRGWHSCNARILGRTFSEG